MPRKYLIEWFRYMGSVLNGKNVVENIKAQDKDILFISGSSDFIFLGGAKKTAKQLHKEIKLLNGCCHICNWDGCDEYNKLVDEFLKR